MLAFGVTTFDTQTFAQISEELASACDWFEEVGVQVSKTRIGRYRDLVSRLVAVRDRTKMKEFFSERELQEFLLLFHEVDELLFVYRYLGNYSDQYLRARIPSICEGPYLASLENPGNSSNRPRNILFELTVAANLAACGMTVDYSDPSDLRVQFDDRTVFIECKRPQYEHQVNSRIKSGLDQLRKRMTRASDVGILAVSIGKMISGGDKLLISQTRFALDKRLDDAVDLFIRGFEGSWNAKSSPGIVSVLIHISAVGVVESEFAPTRAKSIRIVR